MYERIMRDRNNHTFFELLEMVFLENPSGMQNPKGLLWRNRNEVADDNEWMQEYHIIYNSYVLDSKDFQNE